MKVFSLLVALMALSSLGGNGNGSMNLREKAIDTNRPNRNYQRFCLHKPRLFLE